MLVKDIMSTSVKTVRPDTPIIEIVSLMCLYRFSGLPVVDHGSLVGIVAEKDVLARMLPDVGELMNGIGSIDFDLLMKDYCDLMKKPASDLMMPNVLSVSPDMHILKAAATMAGRRFRRIPVTENGALVGMLSLGDVHKAIFHKSLTANLAAA